MKYKILLLLIFFIIINPYLIIDIYSESSFYRESFDLRFVLLLIIKNFSETIIILLNRIFVNI